MGRPRSRILVVEDDEAHAEALRVALESIGHQVDVADSVDAALDRVRARPYDLVLSDVVLGARDGLDLLRELRGLDRELSVILISGQGTIESAVQAMREGAADYITKPVNILELRTRVARELEQRRLTQDNRELRAELDRRYGLDGLVGESAAMEQVVEMVRQVAPTDATVLLLGETGTGKDLVARAIHRLSPRSSRRFVAVNCAALSETLIESELFGHVKGAFTGALHGKEGKFEFASGGTLFLDEIGDMPAATQAKLLRVLEDMTVVPVGANSERPVDVRVIAATNQDLAERVRAGRFREDLYYRLAVITIDLPPLREHLEDVPALLHHFLQEYARRYSHPIRELRPEVLERLLQYDWPGNVRELRNAAERMVVMDRDGILGLEDLPPRFQPRALAAPAARAALPAPGEVVEADWEPGAASPAGGARRGEDAGVPEPGSGYRLAGRSLAEVERDLIQATLELVGGNRQRAARMLGIGERTLYRKIKEYGLQSTPRS